MRVGPKGPRRFTGPAAGLGAALDRLYLDYNRAAVVADPVEIVRRFSAPEDQEVVGFCAAGLAFGRVASVIQSVERLVALMGPRPADYVRQFDPSRDAPSFAGLGHRWTRAVDLVALLWLLRQMIESRGSIEAFFLAGDDPQAPDVRPAIESFSTRAMALDLHRVYGPVPPERGVGYFFPRPSLGSACKRMNLFLRWMVRRDAIDLGAWTGLSPARLVIPLDVHVIRLGRCLRLTRYESPGWKMASEITASLRQLDPRDPVRYDFALCHVGMRDACGYNRPFGDSRCPLSGFCSPRGRTRRASPPPSDPR